MKAASKRHRRAVHEGRQHEEGRDRAGEADPQVEPQHRLVPPAERPRRREGQRQRRLDAPVRRRLHLVGNVIALSLRRH